MISIEYDLGKIDEILPLYPPADYANKSAGLKDACDVIAHYTTSSLALDGFGEPRCQVSEVDGCFRISASASGRQSDLDAFAARHKVVMGVDVGGKALVGMRMMQDLGVWNPMSGYPVNGNPADGRCKWNLFLPLGMGLLNHKAVTLLHYPPWQALAGASYLDNMTLQRWQRLLACTGISEADQHAYKTIIDVNPVAAPGSGQSEYENDYFPIMMSSAFFDGASDRDYIRSMLEVYLNGPQATGTKYTLPLLVGGSPLYDPQAPGWFRVAFKDQMPVDANGIPQAAVLQAGTIKINDHSKRETPYMIANHMIAAGVTGRCTSEPGNIPDIRTYEAQDLVAASFLAQYATDPDIDPALARKNAYGRWFGSGELSPQTGPVPDSPGDRLVICALAQMDLFFEADPSPHPRYTFEEAMQRCRGAANGDNPCCGSIAPKDGKE